MQFTQFKSLSAAVGGSNIPRHTPQETVWLFLSEIIRKHVIRHLCAPIETASYDYSNIILPSVNL